MTSNVVHMQTDHGPPGDTAIVDAPAETKPKRKVKVRSPEFFDNLAKIRQNFALIYGTETVFDGTTKTVQKISAMKHVYQEAFDVWLKSPEKRKVMPDEVRFDPADPEYQWNLFQPWPCRPIKGDCTLIVDHLRYLCTNSPEAFEWILNWCAIVVRKPGVKMRTAILMHGPEGSGKNRFWEAFGEILAPYGKMIGQAELGRDFNEWASAALFLLANEVSTRREKFEIPGKLKALISDPTIYINAKGMPPRIEDNRANFVFLSNEANPIPLGQTDRRYCVIWTPAAHPNGKEYYDRLSAQIRNGGVAAFYDFLLRRDVGDQDEHSRPPQTEARADVIQASLGSVELWLQDVQQHADDADDALAFIGEDAFERYRHWCRAANERHVVSRAVFYSSIRKSRLRTKRLDVDVSAVSRKQATVYFDGEKCPDGGKFIMEAVARFKQRHPLPAGVSDGY